MRAEGTPEVVMLSGGEPTIHPQILDIVALAKAKDIGMVTLNTNAVRLAGTAASGMPSPPWSSSPTCSSTGSTRRPTSALRGRDLRAEKEAALRRCAELGLAVCLVVTETLVP